MHLSDTELFLQYAGLILALISLIYLAIQTARNTKISRATFWLDLRERFAAYDDVHLKLRPGGEWTLPNAGPKTAAEWMRVEAYMGLFEHCNIMLTDKLIDINTFHKVYRYRLHNIVSNETIKNAKLKDPALNQNWVEFIQLLNRCYIKY